MKRAVPQRIFLGICGELHDGFRCLRILHVAFVRVLDDPGCSWRKEFEASTGFPTG